jgi:hypothetical protein
MMTATGTPPAGRIRAAWAAAHTPAAGVSRRVRIAAGAVPLTVLPSSLWRIAVYTFHAPITRGDLGSVQTSSGLPGVPLALYVILLSIVSELLAFAAVGLVSTWGEVFPRWTPVLHGRRVPALFAVIPRRAGRGRADAAVDVGGSEPVAGAAHRRPPAYPERPAGLW